VLAILFFALAVYVVASAVFALAHGRHPHENDLGFAVCVLSGVAMPFLALAKHRAGAALLTTGSPAVGRLLSADAAETALCGVLSVSTLVGVGLSAWAGWWWADPLASLVVVYFALREGLEAWRCDPD
jgi:divalent metal cation (Fe/Co/Zn/Cd) transporter